MERADSGFVSNTLASVSGSKYAKEARTMPIAVKLMRETLNVLDLRA